MSLLSKITGKDDEHMKELREHRKEKRKKLLEGRKQRRASRLQNKKARKKACKEEPTKDAEE